MAKAALKTRPSDILRERWLRGRLSYKLHAGQLLLRSKYESEWERTKNQLFVGECSRQFGKSFEMVVGAIELALKKKNARIKYATAFLTDLEEFILPNFNAVLEDCPEDLKAKYIAHKNKFVFPSTGSEIKLVGLDKHPNGLRGNAIDRIIIDEAGFVNGLDYLYKSIIVPATTHRPNCRIFMVSTPPSTPAHDFIDFVHKAEQEGGHVLLTIYDNPMVDEKTIARLMKESGGEASSTWQREYLCKHILDSNLAIIREWSDSYIQDVPRDDYYQFYHKYNSMDLGTKHFTAGIFGYYEFLKARVVIEDEFVLNGPELTTVTLEAEIRKKEKENWSEVPPYLRVSDNNNPLLLQDLSFLHKLHFTPTDKGTLEEMVNAVRIMVAKGQIIIHPKCKQLIGCLKYGVWDKKREKFSESKVFGHFDALAALVYLVRNLNKSTNPIPPTFQVDNSNQIVFIKSVKDQTLSSLKSAFGLAGKR
jgi:hypothetical protein